MDTFRNPLILLDSHSQWIIRDKWRRLVSLVCWCLMSDHASPSIYLALEGNGCTGAKITGVSGLFDFELKSGRGVKQNR